jgi:polysaccharide chain length determinant protein (PEP-CTERM system associated)
MEDLLRQVLLILRAMWLHRRMAVGVAWVVGIVAGAVVFAIPDKYQASARIFVDTDSVLKPLMSGLIVQANTEQQIAMLSRTLISRPNVEKLMRMADLDLEAKSASDRESLIDHVTKTFKIKSVGRDNLYILEYLDPSPQKAQKVVQSMTTIFVESGLGGKRNDTDSARRFLDDQIDIFRKKLEEAETRLKDFKLKNLELELDSQKGSDVRLGEITNQLSQARLELREAENGRNALRQQIVGAEGAAGIAGSSVAIAVPEIDGRIDSMQRKLDALLQQYTEQHPDVRGTRRIIEDLEIQKKAEIAMRRKLAAQNPTAVINTDVVSQSLRATFANAEAQVASLRARVGEYESRLAAAKSKIKLMPQIEAEYAQLNRDYGVIKKNYDDLVQRRESASISEGMSAVSGVADFRLIDPPRASNSPAAPNRLLLLPMALLASLAAGLFASFAASQLRPTFFDSRTLRETTGLPYLGSVSRKLTPVLRARERRSIIRAGLSAGALVGLYAIAIALVFVLAPRAAA